MPKDLQNDFFVLEQQAVATMRAGNYELAERLFRLMLETVISRQTLEKRRIHKGSFYHNLGFSSIFQNRLNDGLHDFLLAYIEDCLNVPKNNEDMADNAPAAKVLRKGFTIKEEHLERLKKSVRNLKLENKQVLDPEVVFGEFLRNLGIGEDDLSVLCSRKPTISDIKDTLVINLTPQAKQILDEIVSKQTEDVLRRATAIARKRKGSVVTEDDLREAIRLLEEEHK